MDRRRGRAEHTIDPDPRLKSSVPLSTIQRFQIPVDTMSESPPKKARTEEAANGDPPVRPPATPQPLWEKFQATKHAGMLGLPPSEPSSPERPSQKDIIVGLAPQPCYWIEGVWKSVVYRLSVFLFEEPTIKLRSPLHLQRTPSFSAARGASAGGVSTFKEPWDMTNCVKSLQRNGLYEGSMTIWQFLASAKEWNGVDLAIDIVSWMQYDACSNLWGEIALDSSSEHGDQARFIFLGFLPTCVRSVDIVEELSKAGGF